MSNIFCHLDSHPTTNQDDLTTMSQVGTDHLDPLIYRVVEVAGEKQLEQCKKISDINQARYDDKTWRRAFLLAGRSSDDYQNICVDKDPKDNYNYTKRDQVVKHRRVDNAEKVLDKILAFRYQTILRLTEKPRFYFGDTHQKTYIYVK